MAWLVGLLQGGKDAKEHRHNSVSIVLLMLLHASLLTQQCRACLL